MLEYTQHDNIATIRMAHGKASALDLELLEQLGLALNRATADRDVAAVILTGTGSIFSAGVDLIRFTSEGPEYRERFPRLLEQTFLELLECTKPLVVAVNGHAIAGGCIMTLIGDYRLMAAGSGRIGLSELLVGVPFPPAAWEVVRFAIPPQHLQALVYTGRTVLPEDGLRLGLLDEVVAPEKLVARAEEIARGLADVPPRVFAYTKRRLRGEMIGRAKSFEGGYEVLEMWGDPATHERIRSYLEKTLRK